MREYSIDLHLHVIMKLDEAVFDNVDEEFRAYIYDLKDERAILAHLAWNLLQGSNLSVLDGWCNLDNSQAEFEIKDFEFLDYERMDNGNEPR